MIHDTNGSQPKTSDREIRICGGGGCRASGSDDIYAAFKSCLGNGTKVIRTGCLGPCSQGPVVMVAPDDVFYESVTPKDAVEIATEHVGNGRIVERLAHRNARDGKVAPTRDSMDFFAGQTRLVLGNCGTVDPESIESYLAHDGYAALRTAIKKMTPDDLIEAMKQSGLRGRGGAGFPTWRKWSAARAASGDVKYVVCNADEGDPGAFMDRSLLEGDPHSIIEGMALAAYAIGAHRGYVYVRAEYPLAVERLSQAIDDARIAGYIGEAALGRTFNFELEIRMGSGAFVCGEETALMASIQGKRGEPRPRPPFPAERGLWEKPTVLNNVETYASVPLIIRNGADWFTQYGTEQSRGTKVFALAGSVNNTGLVEVPIGTTLGHVVHEIGGGVRGDKEFKAAQIGGPSGGCIPREYLNVPLDYAELAELGAIMGSGGLIVMDGDTCMVDVARFFLEFVQEESCGKCAPCRVGTKRMLEIVTRICEGRGREGDIELLIELGNYIKDTALCGLGQTAANPVLSTIRHFREEYEQHIRDRHCVAGVCPSLVRAPCQSACPAGVDVPGFVALVGTGRYAEALKLHRERNPFAAVCARVCFHTCEEKCRRSTIDAPVSIRGIKRYMVDQEITFQVPEVREDRAAAAKKVAIVGAGPAGLSCAYFLARLGYKPVVFEATSRPGGMLVQTIPAYRLPRETIAREIRMIEHLGVEIRTDVRMGTDFSLDDLEAEGYDAAFVAPGAAECVPLGVSGEEADEVVTAGEFLREYNTRGSVKVGKDVVVVGGGNAAIDAARTAVRLGARVTVVYRRGKEHMPAYAEEIEEAENEGVLLNTLTQPVEVVVEDARVTGVRCVSMELGDFDRSGRRRAQKREAESFVIQCDQVVVAVGQKLSHDVSRYSNSLLLNDDGFIRTDPTTGQTSLPWVFSGGDAATGPSSVVNAIAAGERAAVGIDTYLCGEERAFWRLDRPVDVPFDPDSDPSPYEREPLPTIEVERRRNNFTEVELPWTEPVALRQCERCLRCDVGAELLKKEAVHA